MALGKFAPGYYEMTYNAVSVGLVEGVKTLRRSYDAQIINTDKFGSSVDGVYKGGVCFLAMTLKEFKLPETNMLWPFGSDFGAVGQNGRLLSNIASPIILTAEAGSPAATEGPATLTASLAILAPQNDVNMLMGNEQRDIPILFQLLPFDDAGTLRWFSVTGMPV